MSDPETHLPPEILDSIVELLCNEPEALKHCCLVSKPWVPRTRKYLFNNIQFNDAIDLKAWKKTFPDPANSPAYYVHSLLFSGQTTLTPADLEESGWVRSFVNVVRLELWGDVTIDEPGLGPRLVLFGNLLPAIKSLRVVGLLSPSPQLIGLVVSMPLLQDLDIMNFQAGSHDEVEDVPQPLVSPVLTGTLVLRHRLEYVVCRLLHLPNGLNFKKLAFRECAEIDFRWVTALAERSSGTLEYIGLDCWAFSSSAPISLSKAMELKEVVFRTGGPSVAWITKTLETITSGHTALKQVSIDIPCIYPSQREPFGIRIAVRGGDYVHWTMLDRILVQLWESRGIRTRAACQESKGEEKCLECLLPEMTKRGIIELVDSIEWPESL